MGVPRLQNFLGALPGPYLRPLLAAATAAAAESSRLRQELALELALEFEPADKLLVSTGSGAVTFSALLGCSDTVPTGGGGVLRLFLVSGVIG